MACTACEALGAELGFHWGHPGLRAVATDICVSAVRQVRALRVTRVVPPAAGAPRDPAPRGVVTPPPVAGAGSEPSDPRRPLARSPRPAAEAREGERSGAAASALEPPEAEEETSGESEESGSGSEVTTIGPGVTPVTTTGLAAKARPEARPSKEVDEVAKEEVEEARDDGREADKVEPESPEDPPQPRSSTGHRRSKRDSNRSHRSHHHSKRRDKPRRKKPHRAGRKHKRLERADHNPFIKIHRSLDRSYFDFDPTAPRETVAGLPPRPRQ